MPRTFSPSKPLGEVEQRVGDQTSRNLKPETCSKLQELFTISMSPQTQSVKSNAPLHQKYCTPDNVHYDRLNRFGRLSSSKRKTRKFDTKTLASPLLDVSLRKKARNALSQGNNSHLGSASRRQDNIQRYENGNDRIISARTMSYEEQRATNIRRNQQKLRDIGITRLLPSPTVSSKNTLSVTSSTSTPRSILKKGTSYNPKAFTSIGSAQSQSSRRSQHKSIFSPISNAMISESKRIERELKKKLPGRERALREIICTLKTNQPFLVCGPSNDKSTLIAETCKAFDISVILLDCGLMETSGDFYEFILHHLIRIIRNTILNAQCNEINGASQSSKWKLLKPILSNNFSRCRNISDFFFALKFLAATAEDLNYDEEDNITQIASKHPLQFCLILERPNELFRLDRDLPYYLNRNLPHLIRVAYTCKTMSHKFQVITITLPHLPRMHVLNKLQKSCPPDIDPVHFKKYTSYVYTIFTSRNSSHDTDALQYLVTLMWPKYYEPVRKKEMTLENDTRKLLKRFEPHLITTMKELYSVTHYSSEDGAASEIKMPLLMKFVLMASYLCSYINESEDQRFFVAEIRGSISSRRRKRRRVSKNVNSNLKIPQHLLGPKIFSLMRLSAVTYSLLASYDGRPSDIDTSDICTQVTTLERMSLLHRESGESDFSAPKYKCTLDRTKLMRLAESLKFRVDQYLE